jgi:3-deoxy-D-manno-octulosonic-acid transferase
MIRFLYACLMWLLVPLVLLKLFKRARQEPAYGQHIGERFGWYDSPAQAGAVWLHAVSLGETRAAMALVTALRQAHPGIRFVFSHGTATGRMEGLGMVREGDVQVWQPWDTPQAVQRFLQHFKPQLGLLIDTEVWPNLIWQARDQGMPLVLANARLSNKSWRKAQQWRWLAQPAFSSLAAVWAQSEEDAARLRSLGAPVRAITGNLKFDARPDPTLLALGHVWRAQTAKPIVLLAISREGEEAALLDALQQHPAYLHDVQWWIVPRHPQRFEVVADLIQAKGFAMVRRSAWSEQPDAEEHPSTQAIVLGDTLGEMPFYYGAASVGLLGGSFEPFGGQNLIEACACACPVLLGPHTYNFKQAAEWALKAGAAERLTHLSEAVQRAHALALNTVQQKQMAHAAQVFSFAHQGAVARCVALVQPLLKD